MRGKRVLASTLLAALAATALMFVFAGSAGAISGTKCSTAGIKPRPRALIAQHGLSCSAAHRLPGPALHKAKQLGRANKAFRLNRRFACVIVVKRRHILGGVCENAAHQRAVWAY